MNTSSVEQRLHTGAAKSNMTSPDLELGDQARLTLVQSQTGLAEKVPSENMEVVGGTVAQSKKRMKKASSLEHIADEDASSLKKRHTSSFTSLPRSLYDADGKLPVPANEISRSTGATDSDGGILPIPGRLSRRSGTRNLNDWSSPNDYQSSSITSEIDGRSRRSSSRCTTLSDSFNYHTNGDGGEPWSRPGPSSLWHEHTQKHIDAVSEVREATADVTSQGASVSSKPGPSTADGGEEEEEQEMDQEEQWSSSARLEELEAVDSTLDTENADRDCSNSASVSTPTRDTTAE
ncbi:hypothetical protein PoB_005914900 [Plakobranchus ocellatus]|uniref:CARMIL C-terminal domain-containing protein n=1 Tax=Plakobranchus ocellatus TaxID=259542 RepID=A0AAV4CIM8_9GAST|nr:hypothetical protein PoB_005914900 [Plakobranchus ocellatus]